MKHFTYITTNLKNGKQYVGDHSTNNLEDGYLGSGRPYFKSAIKKYGKDNFGKEILEFFDTKKEAFLAQEKWIKEFNTLAPNGYNISPTGGFMSGGKHSEETKKKISLKLKDKKLSIERRKQISEYTSGVKNPMHGKTHSIKSKEKMRILATGRTWTNEMKKKVSKKNLGKKYLGEEYENRYYKLECPYCKKMVDKANFKRWHGEACKNK